MYSYYNENPKGKNTGDCTVRAISKATGKDWGETYLRLCIQGYLDGDMPSANACWGRYLRSIGYRRYIVPDTCPDCYTVGQFAEDHPVGNYILALSGHVVCVQMARSGTAGTAATRTYCITGLRRTDYGLHTLRMAEPLLSTPNAG